MREVPAPHMGSPDPSRPGSEDSATTAHFENEAVSQHVGGALNQRPRNHRQTGPTSVRWTGYIPNKE